MTANYNLDCIERRSDEIDKGEAPLKLDVGLDLTPCTFLLIFCLFLAIFLRLQERKDKVYSHLLVVQTTVLVQFNLCRVQIP